MTSQAPNTSPGYGTQQDNVPRDVKLLRLLFAANSIDSYKDHVPLQLMDFSYRYTTGILKDAAIYNDHGNMASSIVTNAGNVGVPSSKPITIDDVKLASSARSDYQFKNSQSRELLFELANEKNKKPLPNCISTYGIRLPPEKYCLTAKDSDLSDELKYENDIKTKHG